VAACLPLAHLQSTDLCLAAAAAATTPGDTAALSRLSLTQSPCQALPHPFIEGGCLLAIGSGSGSGSLLLLELVGKAEPRVVLKAVTPDNAPVIGVGLQQVRCKVVVISLVMC
jgi:hypothetical protein